MIIIDNILIGILCFLNFSSFILASIIVLLFFLLFVKNYNTCKENIRVLNELNERLNKVDNYVVVEDSCSFLKNAPEISSIKCPVKMPIKDKLESPISSPS
jgi:hypothetical protein